MNKRTMEYQGKTVYKPRYDLVFKAVFLGDLRLLASLLSSILDMDIHAEGLTVLNAELVPEYESARLSRLDIRVKTGEKQIDLELQLDNRYNMEKRSIFYLSKLYIDQMTARMEYKDLNPVIAINILHFRFLPYDEYHNHYRLKNVRTNDELTDAIEVQFIELPKVDPEGSESMKDLWMRYLSADNRDTLAAVAQASPVIAQAVARLVYVSADEQLRYEMHMREKAELDYFSDLGGAKAEGRAEGLAEGEAKGKAEGLAEGEAKGNAEGLAEGEAKGKAEGLAEGKAEGLAEGEAKRRAEIGKQIGRMKAKGMADDDIAELTDLTVAEVEEYHANAQRRDT